METGHTILHRLGSVCICVCVFMGGIRVLLSFKKQRRGQVLLCGPLAVIHVNSLKTTEALTSLFSPNGPCWNVKFNPIIIVVLFNKLMWKQI